MKQMQSGFTLVELMIVVGIIGLLAAIAIPQYADYMQRTKVSSAVTGALGWKTAISLCIQDTGVIANCGTAGTNGIPPDVGAGEINYASSITTNAADAAVTITTTAKDDSGDPLIVIMTPSLVNNGSTIDWTLSGNGCTEPNRSIDCKGF